MLGCLGLILALMVVAAECWSFVVASHLLSTYARAYTGPSWVDTILPIAIIQVVLMVVGVMLAKKTVNRIPQAVMGSMLGGKADLGRIAVGLVGAILLVLPGFFLDIVGILLLLPPTQSLFAGLGQRILMALLRQQMARMGMPMPGAGGGANPFAGMAGMGAAFPGMKPRGPLRPDERVGPGKVIDTTAERVDGKG
jgi:UPF0716 family protein affecting phage T7 exclusion